MFKKLAFVLLLTFVFVGSTQAQFVSAVSQRNTDTDAPEDPQIGPDPLAEDVLVFVDRTHQYNDIPAYLIGAQVIMTANDNKNNSAYELDLTIIADCTVYVFVDNRMGGSPGGKGVDPIVTGMPWLAADGWTDTGDDIGIDESGDGSIDQYSSVFAKPAKAGTIITIKGDTDGHGGNMYGVAVQGPKLKAYNPIPEDGAVQTETWVSASWTPEDTSVSQDVYLSDNFDDVNDGAADAFVGNLTTASLIVGFVGFPFPDGLVPGTTYYWRVDAIEADGTKHIGDVWSFSIPSKTAYDPIPSDGAKFAATDTELSWTAGLNAKVHSVVFGDNFDDVNSAPTGSLVANTTFTPGTLEEGKTYYWRVDESDPPTVIKGKVWNFTTIPNIPITDPNLVAWYKFEIGEGDRIVDFSGHDNHATIVPGTAGTIQWVEGMFNMGLQFFGDNKGYVEMPPNIVTTSEGSIAMWINTSQNDNQGMLWYASNANDGGDGFGGQNEMHLNTNTAGSGQVQLFMEDNPDGPGRTLTYDEIGGTGWRHVVGTWDPTDGMKLYVDGEVVASTDHNNNFSDLSVIRLGRPIGTGNGNRYYEGLMDDVRLFDHEITADQVNEIMTKGEDPSRAGAPSPKNGAVAPINFVTPLTWSAGEGASQHDVYFGADQAAVAGADASDTTGVYVGRQSGTSYMPADITMDSGPYYWRVDEVANDGTIVKGGVWSFSVTDYALIEDFESYNDSDNLVYERYQDGFANPNVNGSAIGYVTGASMETVNVHGGSQSVPFIFNNTTASISEVTLNLTPAQDWTANGVITLSLWFAGDPANVPGQFYVKINGVQINYDGDATNLKVAAWQPWNIDLTAVGTNLSNVTSFAFGIQGPAASGTLLLDDIRLYAMPRELVTPVQPDPAGLLLNLALNEGFGNVAGDSSGNGRNATISGATWHPGGYNGTGSCLDFGGDGDYVGIDDVTYLNDLSAITIAVWVKSDVIGTDKGFLNFEDPTGGDNNGIRYDAAGANGGGTDVLKMAVTSTGGQQQLESSNNAQVTEWQHYCMVWNSGEQLKFYINGFLDTPTDNYAATTGLTTGFQKLLLGKGGKDQAVTDGWDGLIDDLRIYDRPLSEAEIAGLAGRINPFDKPF